MRRAKLTLCVAALLSTACVKSELDVASNHPGNPSAKRGKLAPNTALGEELASPEASRAPTSEPADHQQQTPDKATYVCPMHPEIVRKEPGECPICGMKLVPKQAAK